MGNISSLTTIDYKTVFLGFFAVLFAAKEIIEIVTYFKKKLRIKTGVEDDKETIENRVKKLEEHNTEQDANIQKILKGVDELQLLYIDKAVEDYRFEILDMASAILEGRDYTREQVAHTIKIYGKYEQLLEKNNMTNGEVDASIKIIEQAYTDRKNREI